MILQTSCAACGLTLRGQPALACTFGHSLCTTLRCAIWRGHRIRIRVSVRAS
jgi:hypothetical protein